MKAFLILEDGTVFTGTSIGSPRDMVSEIVFNTSMTGYLEVLTDPSYSGFPLQAGYSGNRRNRYPFPDQTSAREGHDERHDYYQ